MAAAAAPCPYIPPNPSLSKFNEHHLNFSKYIQRLDASAVNSPLHQGQHRALIRTQQFFTGSAVAGAPASTDTAIVVMPTGAGKSGVAAILPYMLNSKRVLIITPSVIITRQLADSFWGELTGNTFYGTRNLVPAEHLASFLEHGKMFDRSLLNNLIPREQNIANVVQQFQQSFLVIVNCQKLSEQSKINIDDLAHIHETNLFDTVIVDEAHHYPAPTWNYIIDKFRCKKVFLTATPQNRGSPIIKNCPNFDEQRKKYIAYEMTREEAINQGLIRSCEFKEEPSAAELHDVDADDPRIFVPVINSMINALQAHDATRPANMADRYQGMILCRSKEQAKKVRDEINRVHGPEVAGCYVNGVPGSDAAFKAFQAGRSQILVTCGKACEGYDNKRVSVVGILRNVRSRVLFNQFVGRCVRKLLPQETIKGVVVSHAIHGQAAMMETLDEMATEDPEEEEDLDI